MVQTAEMKRKKYCKKQEKKGCKPPAQRKGKLTKACKLQRCTGGTRKKRKDAGKKRKPRKKTTPKKTNSANSRNVASKKEKQVAKNLGVRLNKKTKNGGTKPKTKKELQRDVRRAESGISRFLRLQEATNRIERRALGVQSRRDRQFARRVRGTM